MARTRVTYGIGPVNHEKERSNQIPDSALLQGSSRIADEADDREEHQRDEERRAEEAEKGEIAWGGFDARHRNDRCPGHRSF